MGSRNEDDEALSMIYDYYRSHESMSKPMFAATAAAAAAAAVVALLRTIFVWWRLHAEVACMLLASLMLDAPIMIGGRVHLLTHQLL
jgi:preprotein translocase subunit SecF